MARRDLTGAVDFKHLESFAGGDQQVVDEVLAIFREQAAMWLRLLDPAAEDGAWRDAAHTLKGSALGLGAHDLAEACAAAERAATANLAERTIRLDRVRDALDLALADIAAYVHEQALRSLRSPRGA
ncbi:MAG: Hpt domain-containing protein [Caulobacteraceae bacterium]|nr:Hpt domain-containing protein [Caulobacteraceae bacterium]